MSNNNDHLIPQNIKDIANRAHPKNPFTNVNEKTHAVWRLEAIVDYCNKALEDSKR